VLGTEIDDASPQLGSSSSLASAIVSFEGYPFDPKLSGAYG
jgi:hypothetical protein